jgi:hypothetical protein
MKKTRLIVLALTLTAAAWSLPGLALAKGKPVSPDKSAKVASMFDGKAASMFDGKAFDGGSAFDGH